MALIIEGSWSNSGSIDRRSKHENPTQLLPIQGLRANNLHNIPELERLELGHNVSAIKWAGTCPSRSNGENYGKLLQSELLCIMT